MRKLGFALIALAFGALPSAPAVAGCYQPSPCGEYVHHHHRHHHHVRHHASCCNSPGLIYWVQQVAHQNPEYVAPHRIHAPVHRLHHRPIYRPGSPSLRRMHHHRHFRLHQRPIRHVMHLPRLQPKMHRPHRPMKKK